MFGKLDRERKERKMREGKKRNEGEGKIFIHHIVWLINGKKWKEMMHIIDLFLI